VTGERATGLTGPPGPRFYGLCGGATLLLLYSVSVPGLAFFSFVPAILGLLTLTVVWCVKLILSRRGFRRRWGSFAVAPVGGALVCAILHFDVPLQARWSLSQSAFESVVARVSAGPAVGDERDEVNVAHRVGLYSISSGRRVGGDGLIFYEASGAALFDYAGFAYLPNGPTADLATGSFESPEFHHLSGPWYTWTASW
jgi:hypothetical protein